MGMQKISRTQKAVQWIIIVGTLGLIGYVVARAIMHEMRPRTLISIGKTVYHADLNDNPMKISEGFGSRSSLDAGEAILYRYKTDDRWGVQMKNMNFAVDIVWVGSNKRVVDFKENVKPDAMPYKTHLPVAPARYVLGLSAGQIKKAGIKMDTQIKLDIPREGL